MNQVKSSQVAEFKRTVDKRGRTAKKVITLQTGMTKKVVSFKRKTGVTPSVAAPVDTNPSDATGQLPCRAIALSQLLLIIN